MSTTSPHSSSARHEGVDRVPRGPASTVARSVASSLGAALARGKCSCRQRRPMPDRSRARLGRLVSRTGFANAPRTTPRRRSDAPALTHPRADRRSARRRRSHPFCAAPGFRIGGSCGSCTRMAIQSPTDSGTASRRPGSTRPLAVLSTRASDDAWLPPGHGRIYRAARPDVRSGARRAWRTLRPPRMTPPPTGFTPTMTCSMPTGRRIRSQSEGRLQSGARAGRRLCHAPGSSVARGDRKMRRAAPSIPGTLRSTICFCASSNSTAECIISRGLLPPPPHRPGRPDRRSPSRRRTNRHTPGRHPRQLCR